MPDKSFRAFLGAGWGTKDHRKLLNLDAEEQHPIRAVKGLRGILDSLGKTAKENQSDIALARARLDALVALPEGATTNDAELSDIRVNNGGRVFPTAGEAVRSQAASLQDMIANPAEFVPADKNSKVFVREEGKYIYSDGSFREGSNYTTIYFRAVEPFSCYITGS